MGIFSEAKIGAPEEAREIHSREPNDRATTRRHTMKSALALLALLACMTAQASAEPWFYHGLEGPAFTEQSNSTAGYEVRRYPRSFWTATTVTGKNMDKAGSEAFMRLFRYISGDNELKQKIEMTVPVLASVIPGAGPFCEENFTYHFYLPAEFQTNPPKPDDPRVTNVVLDAMDVAVVSFPGWMNEKEAISHGRDLFEDLKEDNVAFNPDMFYTAGYDSPFRLTDRHNEVWAKIQGSASDATTF